MSQLAKKTYAFIIGLAVTMLAAGHAFAQAPATLQDYWNGRAHWQFERKWTDANAPAVGNVAGKIKVANGVWYMFEREFVGGGTPCVNKNNLQLGIRAYRSTDRGATWVGASQLSLAPVPGSDFSCDIADGDAVYDAGSDKWRFLFQCLNDANVWQGCYAERGGADPMGPFDYANSGRKTAVIAPNSLWRFICAGGGVACGGRYIADEGTFDIFRFDGLYYWVAFHGYDGSHGYRGIAKTADFVNWLAGQDQSADLPFDASLSSLDGGSWHETWNAGGNIGAGNGSIVEENGITYQLAEFADQNLACQANQHWDLGLFRTENVASQRWEQLPAGNPIVLSSRLVEGGNILPCNVQYGQMFVDTTAVPNVVYMKYGRSSTDPAYTGTYLYRLVSSLNVLKNGNFLRNVDNWTRRSSGALPNWAVYRYPNQSPDGTQFFATNCGTSPSACPPDSSILQDLDVSAYAGHGFTFGGKFATESGDGGPAALAVWQFDANSNVLRNDVLSIGVNGQNYQSYDSAQLSLLPATRKVRYQFYLGNNVTYFMANLYLNVQ